MTTVGRILRGLAWFAALSRGADEVMLALRRARRRAALTLLGVALALTGGGFLLAAGLMALAYFLGAIPASLIVGAVLIVAAAGLLWSVRRRMAIDTNGHGPGELSPIAATLAGVGREVGAAASRNPGSVVLAAFLIGLLLSRVWMRR